MAVVRCLTLVLMMGALALLVFWTLRLQLTGGAVFLGALSLGGLSAPYVVRWSHRKLGRMF